MEHWIAGGLIGIIVAVIIAGALIYKGKIKKTKDK
jgi:hypothetical protein